MTQTMQNMSDRNDAFVNGNGLDWLVNDYLNWQLDDSDHRTGCRHAVHFPIQYMEFLYVNRWLYKEDNLLGNWLLQTLNQDDFPDHQIKEFNEKLIMKITLLLSQIKFNLRKVIIDKYFLCGSLKGKKRKKGKKGKKGKKVKKIRLRTT